MNCPAPIVVGAPASGSSVRVQVSAVSATRLRTTKDRGTRAPGNETGSAAVAPIDVQQPEARRLQPLEHDLREPLHQFVAEGRILLALAAEAGALERGRAHLRERPGVEVPAIRREEPR